MLAMSIARPGGTRHLKTSEIQMKIEFKPYSFSFKHTLRLSHDLEEVTAIAASRAQASLDDPSRHMVFVTFNKQIPNSLPPIFATANTTRNVVAVWASGQRGKFLSGAIVYVDDTDKESVFSA